MHYHPVSNSVGRRKNDAAPGPEPSFALLGAVVESEGEDEEQEQGSSGEESADVDVSEESEPESPRCVRVSCPILDFLWSSAILFYT